ncbi:hypothetical protein FE257_011812 [Aspergillus nanangensis]|uniref:holo-[acyl-carrier-protein] synthase n=1 Tax=Aspergillus nanangensis TaxID=2582783 RepID=A0AAD4GY44_ASPNN|nr:hypothetical protein FE257_011812 [Aspergillus nanangensis]
MTSQPSHLTRWYIDTRPLTESTPTLPLLDTLQPTQQESIKRFFHLKDRHMSLASNLLKYLFIHRTCHIPWSDIKISRTAAPHHRPCFIPSANTPTPEFNVSHQASLVALAGTSSPPPPPTTTTPSPSLPSPLNPSSPHLPQVGIDITCVNERRNPKTPPPTIQSLADFVDIFAEVFSARELATIKSFARQTGDVEAGYRLFYAYWALKEAYIKMTGEALLAPWLRELEFTNVVAPAPGSTAPYTGVQTWLYREKVEDVRVELVAFEEDYLIATAARGGVVGLSSGSGPSGSLGSGGVDVGDGAGAGAAEEGDDAWGLLEMVDIERDVRPCATGVCGCLGS